MYHPLRSIPSILRWFWNGTGPASSNSVCIVSVQTFTEHALTKILQVGECACFIRSTDTTLPFDSKASANIVPEDTSSSSEAPDLEFVAAGITFINHGFTLPPGYVDMFTIVSETIYASISTRLLNSRSRCPAIYARDRQEQSSWDPYHLSRSPW